jgi:hypothetical protein
MRVLSTWPRVSLRSPGLRSAVFGAGGSRAFSEGKSAGEEVAVWLRPVRERSDMDGPNSNQTGNVATSMRGLCLLRLVGEATWPA